MNKFISSDETGISSLSYPSLVSTKDLTAVPHVSDDPMVSEPLRRLGEHSEHVASSVIIFKSFQILPKKTCLSSFPLAGSG